LTGGALLGAVATVGFAGITGHLATVHAQAGSPSKPNILFIMGDDIGWMQPSIFHRVDGR
jgi:arylsulfatase